MPPDEPRMYVVEMKMHGTCGGGDEVLAMPRCSVPEGRPFTFAYDDSKGLFTVHAVPGEVCPMRTGGHSVSVCVTPDRAGHVMLDVVQHHGQHGKECGGKDVVDRMTSVHMVKRVKLGEATKLHCGECRLEVTVKAAPEYGEEAAEVCPPPPYDCPRYFPAPPYDCPRPFPAPPPTVTPASDPCVTPAAFTAAHPCKADNAPITFRVAAGPKHCPKVRCGTTPKHLEACCGGACMVLDKMELKVSDCDKFEVSVADGKVALTDGHVCVKADKVTVDPDGGLVLEGCVEMKGDGAKRPVKVKDGKVHVAPASTGIISCPTLLP
jgi:hypothetical protein